MMTQPRFDDTFRARKHAGSPGTNRLWRKTTAAIACAFAFTSVAACATVAPYNPDHLASGSLERVGQICRSVVGVQPGEERYAVCVASLSDSVQNRGRAHAMQEARNDCLGRGLRPASADLAVCIVQSANETRASSPDLAMSGPMEQPGLAKSYPYASQHEVHRREELSCARLGLDPASGAFASCVGGLDSALFTADNPSQ